MGIDIRLPNITGTTDREKLTQLQSYLFQMVEQLNWALQNVDSTNVAVSTANAASSTPVQIIQPSSGNANTADPVATFNSIKSLIIKSADIVDAYYQEVSRRLEGLYVAQSDFGDYVEKTSQVIEETSTSTTQRFENIQIIITNQGGEIESVKGDLQTIGENLSYTQNDIFTINSNVEALGGSIASVEGAVGSLDEELQTSKQELQGSVAAAKEELTGSITSTKNELLGTVSNTKTELEGSINSTKESLLGDISGARSELEGSINSVKTVLEGSIDGAKEELSGSIDAAKSELTGSINSTKSELEGTIDSTKEELAGDINDTNTRIAGAEQTIGSHEEMLKTATEAVDGLTTKLDETKKAIDEEFDKVRGEEGIGGVNKLLDDAKKQLEGSLNDIGSAVAGLTNLIDTSDGNSVTIGVTAYVKSGLLYNDEGIPVYGVEVGQSVNESGTEVYNKYARFTSEKLSFYDSNGTEVAYISDKKLFIKQAEITVAFQIGKLMDLVMDNGDVVTKWVGG